MKRKHDDDQQVLQERSSPVSGTALTRRKTVHNSLPQSFHAKPANANNNLCTDLKRKISLPATELRLLVPRSNIFQTTRADELFRQHAARRTPLLLIFYDSVVTDTSENGAVGLICKGLAKYAGSIVAVSDECKIEDREWEISRIEDENGVLAREVGALNPIGGGTSPMHCLVFIDCLMRMRAFANIARMRPQECVDKVKSTLEYLMWEQQRY